MRKLGVIWSAAGLLMAIDSQEIVEVLPPVTCRPAPGIANWLRGLFVYRGSLIPLVDAGVLLGASRAPERMANRVIVTRVSNALSSTSASPWPVAIWVDSVLEIDRVDFDASGGHPGFGGDGARFLGPIAQTRWGTVQLIRSDELFNAEQVRVLSERIAEAAA